jgi:hypothetical protein
MSSNEVPGAISAWQRIKELTDRISSTHVCQDKCLPKIEYNDDLYFDSEGRYPLKDLLGQHD